ncbi:putative glycerol-3-phosphate dehydrogenase [Nosema granulosis]|uniref:Glycerol-3-phosphate dehydrogenase n=1 Tax=Nosema granulosis TaxID=83296 RepID=A0A9P6KZ03_9MICR|nr:putative glycerol-3-phosphate dehydrogenase [Nosema granulosis]
MIAKAFLKPYNVEWRPKSREEILRDLSNEMFDILIVGGGSSGVGCAVDAATRGLKVALVESDDFGSGTSSKSTKLLHGGVRYLEKAFIDFDYSQFKLVSEALQERKVVMDACPYLTKTIDIMFPIYTRALFIYYYIGLKLYDWLSGSQSLGRSRFINYNQTIENYKHVRKDRLVGSIVYKDGQFFDAKYNVIVGLTAAYFGASIINHCELRQFVKQNNKITGAVVFDKLAQKEYTVKSKVVINTTGQFADEVRHLAENDDKNIVMQSSGTHIVVSNEFGPTNMGFVDPNTADGRLAFLLPYKGKMLMGATDIKCNELPRAVPKEEDLEFLMHEVDFYTERNIELRKKDVMSVWTGIRPLIRDTSKANTEKIVRRHSINIDDDGLVTLTGGKWTIYRLMAEQAIDATISKFKLKPTRCCLTKSLKMIGAQTYSDFAIDEIRTHLSVPQDIAEHLATSYGTRAFLISRYMENGYTRLVEDYPYIKEEIYYQMEFEMAVKISDVLFNRLLISYIDVRKASKMVEQIGRIMQRHYEWSEERYETECNQCNGYLETMGLTLLCKK